MHDEDSAVFLKNVTLMYLAIICQNVLILLTTCVEMLMNKQKEIFSFSFTFRYFRVCVCVCARVHVCARVLERPW